jgi:hypothetical protein
MNDLINVYCDESCHLEHDRQKVMVLGSVWLPNALVKEVGHRIGEIKQNHGLHPKAELKWTKISRSKQTCYLDLINYFFDVESLHFRTLVAPKVQLDHDQYLQTHDDWYYKMYFDMLKILFSPEAQYFVYLDIKDSRGGEKVHRLREILCNSMYDFDRQIIQRIQIIRSDESPIMQLTDVLIGAVAYANRKLTNNPAKLAIVEKIKMRTGYRLTQSTLYREDKFNIFCWQPSQGENAQTT